MYNQQFAPIFYNISRSNKGNNFSLTEFESVKTNNSFLIKSSYAKIEFLNSHDVKISISNNMPAMSDCIFLVNSRLNLTFEGNQP